jgi:hypothetical protein
MPSAGASPPTSAGAVEGKAAQVAGSAVGTAKDAAGKAVGAAPSVYAVNDLKGTAEASAAANSRVHVGNLPTGVVAAVVKLVNTVAHSCVSRLGGPCPGLRGQRDLRRVPDQGRHCGTGHSDRGGFGANCPSPNGVELMIAGQCGVLQAPVSTAAGTSQPVNVRVPGSRHDGPGDRGAVACPRSSAEAQARPFRWCLPLR